MDSGGTLGVVGWGWEVPAETVEKCFVEAKIRRKYKGVTSAKYTQNIVKMRLSSDLGKCEKSR